MEEGSKDEIPAGEKQADFGKRFQRKEEVCEKGPKARKKSVHGPEVTKNGE